jgi:hypothetical protein
MPGVAALIALIGLGALAWLMMDGKKNMLAKIKNYSSRKRLKSRI